MVVHVHVLLYLSRIEILHVSVWHNAAGRKIMCPQNQVSRQKVPFLAQKMCALFRS